MLQVFVKVSSTINLKPNTEPRSEDYERAAYATMCDRAEAEIIGKLVSTALESGTTPIDVAVLLRGVDCGHPYIVPKGHGRLFEGETITSMADLVGRAMLLFMMEHAYTQQ